MNAGDGCDVPARGAGAWARLRGWLACRRCAVGWTLYLAAAALAVALFAR
ncbi:MAG: hypothetical protein OEX23_01660 [Betaproteobacteria bacterium]|nr:hypothetical protein [Betaproteobacteria bacterium]